MDKYLGACVQVAWGHPMIEKLWNRILLSNICLLNDILEGGSWETSREFEVHE